MPAHCSKLAPGLKLNGELNGRFENSIVKPMWKQQLKFLFSPRVAGLFLCLWGLAVAPVSRADDIPGLYETEITVSTQDAGERKAALTAAMRQVLLRVSGRGIVLTITAIEEALTQPTRYVQRYRYRNRAGADGAQEKRLWVRFDEKAINKLLRDNRMPVWGRTRPAVLVWMVVDDRESRILLGKDISHPARAFLEEQARLRGIPLRWPMLDLIDRGNITASDVWGSFEDSILKASRRYQTEAVLVGRVYKRYDGSWSVRWTLYDHGHREDWNARAESLVEALIPGVDHTAGILAQRFARVETGEQGQSLLVQVEGINSLPAYNRVLKYLSGLSLVSNVQPQAVLPDRVIFRLDSRSGRLALAQAIALGHTLVEKAVRNPPAASAAAGRAAVPRADLDYYLIQ